MSRYALLLAPSANRVYADQAGRLSQVELAAFGPALSAPLDDIGTSLLGGVEYLTFAADLTARDVALLSNLSAAYALFGLPGDGSLRPVTMEPLARYDSDLITIPKYAGKTNEQFTKLLLNLTLLAGATAGRMLDGTVTVCDPLCGRGTTLNQALMYGYDAVGVEIDAKDVEAYAAFLKAYLKRKRLKHTAELVPVRRAGKRAARRLDVTLAPSKEDHKAGAVQKVTVLQADTTRLDGLLKAPCADVLVADLPYGVAHGSYDDEGNLNRRPLDLLERAVPQWVGLLRPGGAIGLSWNLKVARRDLAEDILLANGLEVVRHGDLSHRVDQGIERDVVVARKPG
ncbi:TRM11 family SAM-dependent methyltransferase [Jidongwangia harbinensis]|uniref:TRM11 family SAM-dependent methyltransferase n=1 Tax=Jidongwangia harbinensis TaxID=2878561 RepID=UPI001CD9A86C|nr:SAM-dependent methyltransferase [Jidongwangia harbinensis]MCA2215222.1 SAM-dependent methyltransferase [Jidongwangia harbinensis]